jgi:hypothetical protein
VQFVIEREALRVIDRGCHAMFASGSPLRF